MNKQVYCGHEYTKKNLEFTLSVDPDNADVKQKAHTVPSTVGEEKRINPFMKVRDEAFVKSLNLPEGNDPIDRRGGGISENFEFREYSKQDRKKNTSNNIHNIL